MKMRITILTFVFFIINMSCSKENEVTPHDPTRIVNDSVRTYNDSSGTWVTISESIWFTTRGGERWDSSSYWAGGTVYLVISGSTNADKITVIDYGFGLYHEEEVTLDSNKNFYKDTTRTAAAPLSSDSYLPVIRGSETYITAYREDDTLEIHFAVNDTLMF